MRIASIHAGIGVHARYLLLTALRKRHELQAKAVYLLAWP
jgi:hypothetical protein